jgi:hypothetical protein
MATLNQTSKPIKNHKELNDALVEVGSSLLTVGNALYNLGLGVGSVAEICFENACDMVTTAYNATQPKMPSYKYVVCINDGDGYVYKTSDVTSVECDNDDFVMIDNKDLN